MPYKVKINIVVIWLNALIDINYLCKFFIYYYALGILFEE